MIPENVPPFRWMAGVWRMWPWKWRKKPTCRREEGEAEERHSTRGIMWAVIKDAPLNNYIFHFACTWQQQQRRWSTVPQQGTRIITQSEKLKKMSVRIIIITTRIVYIYLLKIGYSANEKQTNIRPQYFIHANKIKWQIFRRVQCGFAKFN